MEQTIIVISLATILLALVSDTLYHNNINLGVGTWTETAVFIFALFQMTAMALSTIREATAARERELLLLSENASLALHWRRMRELFEQVELSPEWYLVQGSLVLDIVAGIAYIDGEDIGLMPKEFAVLLLLAQNRGHAISAQKVYEGVWKRPMAGDVNAVKSAVSRLRKKLKGSGCSIAATRGEGYRFDLKE